ncbi:MAG: hypothetical protein DMF78_24000 [Acidobacteria bacterium]|nr:MAG: hypothetical protein DMF78_24000 [Acidobacteriota bacterium]
MSSPVDAADVLDCSRIAPQRHPEMVLDAFDSLAPGQRIRLVCAEAPAGGVTEAMVWDHARLDGLETAAFEARARRALSTARALFTDFAHGLRRHIDFEEQILFPEFEARWRFPEENGPTAVMRAEHRAILPSSSSWSARSTIPRRRSS